MAQTGSAKSAWSHWLAQVTDAMATLDGPKASLLLNLTKKQPIDAVLKTISVERVRAAVEQAAMTRIPPSNRKAAVNIISAHLSLRKTILVDNVLWPDAVKTGNRVFDLLLEYYLEFPSNEHNWLVPILASLCAALHRIADFADECIDETIVDDAEGSEEFQKRYTKEFLNQIRCKLGSLRGDEERHGAYIVLLAQSIKGCMALGNAQMAASFLKATETCKLNVRKAPRSPMVNFRYYLGKLMLQQEDYVKAEAELSWALAQCPRRSKRMRHNILECLCAVRIRHGVLPPVELLDRYNLPYYVGIRQAIARGNIQLFDETVSTHDRAIVTAGTVLCVEKLRFLVFRTLIRKVKSWAQMHNIGPKSSIVPIGLFTAAAQWQVEDSLDDDEIACIIANLIKLSLLKGYISWDHMVVVFSTQEPFPRISPGATGETYLWKSDGLSHPSFV